MPDYNQAARNVLYGAVHRPAQVLRWMGGLFHNEAAPVGAALISAADMVDTEAYDQLQPFNPGPPALTIPPPPSPVTTQPPTTGGFTYILPPWVYTPAPGLTYAQQVAGYSYVWVYGPGNPPAGLHPGPGWGYAYASGAVGPGHWELILVPPV